MSGPSMKLYRLRGIFVVYFIAKFLIGAAVAWSVVRPMVDWHLDRLGWSISSLTIFSLIAAAVLLAIAMLIFGQLLLRRNWARILLLAIAWFTVFSAVFSLLVSARIPNMGSWIAQWLPDMDWPKLMRYDRIQKVFELLFWGYLISVLQFDPVVRDEFFPQKPSAGQAGEAQ
jgi:MFS family permease